VTAIEDGTAQNRLASLTKGGKVESGNVACIDVGNTKICTIIASVSDEGINEVLGVGRVPSRGIRKGIIVNPDDATEAIRRSIEEAEIAVSKVDLPLVGFSSKHIGSINCMGSVDVPRQGHLITESIIAQAEREAMQDVVFPEGQRMVNIVKTYALDGVKGTKNPLGMHAFRLDLEAHIIAADSTCVGNIARCLKQAGVAVSPDSFVVNPLASSEAVLEPEEKEAGVILADIGGGTTGITVFRKGAVQHTSALPVGGRQVTKDLAAGLNISFSAAEELKINNGSLYSEEKIKIASTEMKKKYKTSAERMSYIIRVRMKEILRMILSESPYVPNILVLTGGGANLPGTEQFAREVVGLQVRVGRPRGLSQGADGLDDPSYAASAGLLLWGAQR